MTSANENRMAELLSKLKRSGRLRYWRGTIEIPEQELHAICDEIQAEYDDAVAAMNKAAGNWAKADDRLRRALDFMRIWISEDAHLGESEISAGLEKDEGLRKLEAVEQAIAATLGSDREKELEKLAYDMWWEMTTCPDYRMPPCMTENICERVRSLGIGMNKLMVATG